MKGKDYIYKGHWRNNLPDGEGEEIKGLTIFKGHFLQGKKNG
jgi:hypothetical protein